MRMKNCSSKVVLATVYNNLNSLHRQGLIRKVTMENAPDCYDKATRHDHIICKKCGKLSDIILEDLTAKWTEETGISIDSYDLKLFYICEECRKKEGGL